MITPEKNDIDVEKLFHWGDSFNIHLPNDNFITVYIRVVSDEELNKSRVYALRKAGELKDKLYNKNSDNRKAYIPNMDKMLKNEIIDMILVYRLPDIHKKVSSEIILPFPKEPDEDAPTSEWVEYQKKIDEYPNEFSKMVREGIQDAINEEKNKLNSFKKDMLKRILERTIIESVISKELESKFLDSCVYFGTYKDIDYKNRVFKSPEDVSKLPSMIRDQFVTAYMTLDIPMEELKK